jgi:SOS-response transcriptional repressor LexA
MLTQRQSELLAYLRAYEAAHPGISPSFDEMAAAIGYTSKSGVYRMLGSLEERGFIRRLKYRARAIEVLPEGAKDRFRVRFVKCRHCHRMTPVDRHNADNDDG